MPTFLDYVKPNEPVLPKIVGMKYPLGMPTNSDKPYADIGARLKWHRDLLGLEQSDYAKTLKSIKRSAYSNWEVGSSRLSLNGALEICEAHGLSLDFLFMGSADTLPLALRNAWMSKDRVSS